MVRPWSEHKPLISSASVLLKPVTLMWVTPANLRSALPAGQHATSKHEKLFAAANSSTLFKGKSGSIAVKNPRFICLSTELHLEVVCHSHAWNMTEMMIVGQYHGPDPFCAAGDDNIGWPYHTVIKLRPLPRFGSCCFPE